MRNSVRPERFRKCEKRLPEYVFSADGRALRTRLIGKEHRLEAYANATLVGRVVAAGPWIPVKKFFTHLSTLWNPM